jgi:hypothetical protein
VLIIPFGSAQEFRLVSHLPGDDVEGGEEVAPTWAIGAILLDRWVPEPRLGGMMVELSRRSYPAMTE